MQCCAAVRATSWKQQTPQLWTKESGEGGAGVYSFVVSGYPIWVQCLNNFVADCNLIFGNVIPTENCSSLTEK